MEKISVVAVTTHARLLSACRGGAILCLHLGMECTRYKRVGVASPLLPPHSIDGIQSIHQQATPRVSSQIADQGLPGFNTMAASHTTMAVHLGTMQNIPAFDVEEQILEAIARLSRKIDQRFDAM